MTKRPSKFSQFVKQTEWTQFLRLKETGASKTRLIAFAQTMSDQDNKKVALRFLARTACDRRESAARQNQIDATSQEEINRNFSMEGLK